ncbi:MAG: hypothetical protein AB1546_03995, partial [bacterium]
MAVYSRRIKSKQRGNELRILYILPVSIVFALSVGTLFNYLAISRSIFVLVFAALTFLFFYRPIWGIVALFVLTLLSFSISERGFQLLTMNRFIGMILVMALLAITAQSKKFQFRAVSIQTYLLGAYLLTAMLSLILSRTGMTPVGMASVRQLIISYSLYFLVINVIKRREELTIIACTIISCSFLSILYSFIVPPPEGEIRVS